MQQQPKRTVAAVVAAGNATAATSNPAEIGARMKVAREALGLSRPAFTTKCGGITVRTLENNEGGANEAGAGLVAAFVRLGINANWLLTGEGPMLLKDLATAQQPKINVAALSAIIEGLIKAGAPPDKVGHTALRYYDDAIAQGLITPDGIGSGGKHAA